MKKNKKVLEFERIYGEAIVTLDSRIRYHNIHPFYDDIILLKELDILPESIFQVDAYVNYDNIIFFLQVLLSKYSDDREAGIYLRINDQKKLYVLFVLNERSLTRKVLETNIIDFVIMFKKLIYSDLIKKLDNKLRNFLSLHSV